MGRGRKAYGSSLSMTETEMKVWRLGVPSTTVLPHTSLAPFSKKTKHSRNLTIDFPFTAPQDTKQGYHYGLYSLQEELKTVCLPSPGEPACGKSDATCKLKFIVMLLPKRQVGMTKFNFKHIPKQKNIKKEIFLLYCHTLLSQESLHHKEPSICCEAEFCSGKPPRDTQAWRNQ